MPGRAASRARCWQDSENLSALANADVAARGYGAAARGAIESLPSGRPRSATASCTAAGSHVRGPHRRHRARPARRAGRRRATPQPTKPGGIVRPQKLLPDVPHVATFDTAFHATMRAAATTFPIPYEWTRDWTIRRYGFHGLSFEYSARRAPELLGHPIERLVACHLGQGCSAAAILRGRSVDTTMGFTPLDGLMMATRGGSIIQASSRTCSAAATCPPPTSMTRSTIAPGCSASRASPPTCARCSRPPAPATSARSSRSASTCAACARRSARSPRRWGDSTRSCSRAASASTRSNPRIGVPRAGLPRRRARRRCQRTLPSRHGHRRPWLARPRARDRRARGSIDARRGAARVMIAACGCGGSPSRWLRVSPHTPARTTRPPQAKARGRTSRSSRTGSTSRARTSSTPTARDSTAAAPTSTTSAPARRARSCPPIRTASIAGPTS